MHTADPQFWWAFGIGSVALLAIVISYIAAVASGRRRLIRSQKQQIDQMRSFSSRLQSIREEERTHLAREVHDELGQTLTGAKMYLVTLRDSVRSSKRGNTPALFKTIDSVIKLMDDSINLVKNLASELRPDLLHELGLEEAIRWEAKQFKQRTGIPCIVSSEDQMMALGKERSLAVFRVFQEALTNVARHAKAKTVDVRLRKDDGRIVLEVKDDGRGIREQELADVRSLGLLGMKERAVFLGGTLDVSAIHENGTRGTRVTLSMPLEAESNLEELSGENT